MLAKQVLNLFIGSFKVSFEEFKEEEKVVGGLQEEEELGLRTARFGRGTWDKNC